MMNVYREILPESYLLILTSAATAADAESLRHALHRGSASGKPNIWIDCSSISTLSAASLEVLGDFYPRLQRRHIALVLCHLPDQAADTLKTLPPAQRPPVVATLLEAACYCRSQRPARRASAIALRPIR